MTEAGAGIGPWSWPGDEEFTQAEISIPKRNTSLSPAHSATPSGRRVKRAYVRWNCQPRHCWPPVWSNNLYTTTTVPCPTAYEITPQSVRERPSISGPFCICWR